MVRQWFDIGCAWAKARYDEQHPSRGIVSGEELRRLFVVHMNFRLALRFPHRNLYWLVSEIILLIVVERATGRGGCVVNRILPIGFIGLDWLDKHRLIQDQRQRVA